MTIKVLAVDDEQDMRRLVSVILKKAGFDVITAVDGKEGLEAAIAHRPDIVLMDVMMPVMNGLTAATRIKSEIEPPPITVMLTAKGGEDDIMIGLLSGADDYVIKPFTARELIVRIKLLLIKAGRRDELPE